MDVPSAGMARWLMAGACVILLASASAMEASGAVAAAQAPSGTGSGGAASGTAGPAAAAGGAATSGTVSGAATGAASAVGTAAAPAAKRSPPMKTGFVFDEIYLKHDTGAGHPERPDRLRAIVKRLKDDGMMERLVQIAAAPAPLEWITAIHTPQYVEEVRKANAAGGRVLDLGDTPVSADSYQAALMAAGGVLQAVDAVMAGKVASAFCAVRPPGHHALKDRAMGFCIFNNVAIATRYIQKKHGLAKVLIVDWDVHQGNGTMAAFYDDPSVLQFDTHQWPFYPGSGAESETGAGKAVGLKINVPLPAGSGDAVYKEVFEKKLRPAALAFRPDFVLISAGFDAHENDTLGGMKVTTQGYADLTRIVKAIAAECCKGRIVSVLEGGYGLEGLAASVEAHIKVLMEAP